MQTVLMDCGVKVEFPDDVAFHEVEEIANDEMREWSKNNKHISRVEVKHADDNETFEVTAFERSPIRRIRRITGYCVNIDNWNAAKKEELAQRTTHF